MDTLKQRLTCLLISSVLEIQAVTVGVETPSLDAGKYRKDNSLTQVTKRSVVMQGLHARG